MTDLLPDAIAPLAAVLLVATTWFTAAVTATVGLGGGVILLAVLLAVVPASVGATTVLALHGVLQLGANASRSWFMRRDVLRRELLWFLPGALVGVALASLVVVELPTRVLSATLAAFILWTVWAPKPAPRSLAPARFALVGAVTSFATMFLGATGPLIAAFLSPERYGRRATVATHGAMMTVQHGFKVVAFGLLGFSLADWLPLVMAMLATGVLGSWSGRFFLNRLPEPTFRIGFRVVMTLLALRLLGEATG